MSDVVIVEAVRSAVGKKRGGLSHYPSPDLFADVLKAAVDRARVDSALVGQVAGGCVSQVGMQAGNVTRSAWLAAGLDHRTAAFTVHTQCGSSQQAFTLAYGLVKSGVTEVAVAGGVESMNQVPMGSSALPELGTSRTPRYEQRYEIVSQFEAAERIAEKWGVTREDAERFAVSSQERAARAIAERRFESQIVPVEAPVVDEDGAVVGTKTIAVDEGPRATTLESLAGLRLNMPDRPGGCVHTAGASSQISDGASALVLTTEAKAAELGLRPRARVVDSILVGSDPVLTLTGPIPATQALLERTGLSLADIDVVEVNEAFASIVLAWAQETKADLERVNVNGGAIALGHPLGGTGGILLTKALNELERTGGRYGMVTMCVGGGQGTGTIIERL